jgi:hypothetical protein
MSLCKDWLDDLTNKGILVKRGNRYLVNEGSDKVSYLYKMYSSASPSSTEEFVMDLLCSNYGLYKGEVCELMSEVYGLSKSAVYKAIDKLEIGNFINVTSKHTGKRGPAGDYISVNCGNCFFLYASQEECLEYEVGSFAKNIERGFARKLGNEEKVALLKFMKGRAEGPQLLRKLNRILYYFIQLKQEIAKDNSLKKAMSFMEKEMDLTLSL